MKKRDLDNLLVALRKADIQDLQSLETMPRQNFQHFLQLVDAGSFASAQGLSRAKNLVTSFRKSKLSPQTSTVSRGANEVLPVSKPLTSLSKKNIIVGNTIKLEPNFRSPSAAAVFTLNITRLTHALDQTLYVAVFGPLDYRSSYNQVITDLNPGLTWTVELMTNKRGLKFTFTDGTDADIVNVECGEVAYVNLLEACKGSILNMSQTKLNISDATAQQEFAASFWLIKNSLFGKLEKDSFTPNMFKTDLQNQNDIRIVTAEWSFDQESCMAVPMVDGFTALQLSITSNVASYDTSRV